MILKIQDEFVIGGIQVARECLGMEHFSIWGVFIWLELGEMFDPRWMVCGESFDVSLDNNDH